MQRPLPLKSGDTIQIIAPSRWLEESALTQAISLIESHGYHAKYSADLLARDRQFAGSDELRSAEFSKAWADPSVAAIWIARGGYGAQRIVDSIQSIRETKRTKWLIGFSDTTAIHGLLNSLDICSIHGPLLSTVNTNAEEDISEVFQILVGNPSDELNILPEEHDMLGNASGRLVGGNLSVLQTMLGTPGFPVRKGDILFIEDVDEMLYHIDRMMLHMRRCGILDSLAGLLVGGMTDMRDNTKAFGFSSDNPFGANAYEIIASHSVALGIPIAFGLPCGHAERNFPLMLGAKVDLFVGPSGSVIRYT